MMTSKEIRKNLEAKNYDAFCEDLQLEVQMCQGSISSSFHIETVEELVEYYGHNTIVNFLCEDFPDRYFD